MTKNQFTADAVSKTNIPEQLTLENSTQNTKEDIFNPERLKLSSNFSASVVVKNRLTVIQVRKPPCVRIVFA